MKLYIKNMVCPRCIMSVEDLLKREQVAYRTVRLGEVETEEELSRQELSRFSGDLEKMGFELLNDPSSKLIEEIKRLLIQKIQGGIEEHFSIQKFLKEKIFKDYSAISKLFSQVEGITIEQYLIFQKIEKVKELLVYNEMSLSEIAISLGYSSSQHLSSQFKKITGMTPTRLREIGNKERHFIDSSGITRQKG